MKIWLAAVALACGWSLWVPACSLDNQEGPVTSCEELSCGRINACEQGIIAQCVDGRTLRYHVCSAEDICGADWQIAGQFRCSEELTDCEGCRPERQGCDDLPPLGGGGEGAGPPAAGGAGAGGAGAGGAGGAAGGAGGTGGG